MACLLSYYSYIFSFIIYCLRHLLLFTCKQSCLQTCKYDQSPPVTEIYTPIKFHVELWVLILNEEEEKKKKNSSHHSL